jgi:hypothetical protein
MGPVGSLIELRVGVWVIRWLSWVVCVNVVRLASFYTLNVSWFCEFSGAP